MGLEQIRCDKSEKVAVKEVRTFFLFFVLFLSLSSRKVRAIDIRVQARKKINVCIDYSLPLFSSIIYFR